MKSRLCFPGIALAGILTCAHGGHAEPDQVPRILRLEISDREIGLRARQKNETRKSKNSAATSDFEQDRLEITPSLGLTLEGSVYHPNLVDFNLFAEGGVNWENETLDSGPGSPVLEREDTNPLQLYNLTVRILKEKPYTVSLFADKSEVRRDNDFFSRFTLEREAYGGQLGYSSGSFPFRVSVRHTEEEESDTDRPRTVEEDEYRFTISNDRLSSGGRTRFTFTQEDFERSELDTPTLEGTRLFAGLTDSESFMEDSLRLFSEARFTDVDSTSIPSSTLSVRERLTRKHSDTLRSDYHYLFSDDEFGDSRSTIHEGRAAVRHQLYESLSSGAEIEYRTTEEPGLDTQRYGGGIDEDYTKRLGEAGRLNVGIDFKLYDEERESAGESLSVVNERHVLADGRVTILNRTGADAASIVVSDTSGTIRYIENRDYRVFPRGATVEIRRTVGGDIPNGGTVVVNYTAVGQASDGFLTREERYRVRLSLFERLLMLYARFNVTDHSGGEALVLQDIDEQIAGIESSWRWFHLGAEYRNYDSNLLPFSSIRFFQNLLFHPTRSSALSFGFTQMETTYDDTDEEIRTQSYIARYETRLTQSLAFSAEGGFWQERGDVDKSLDRDVTTIQTDIDYWIGQTTVKFGYEYREEDYLAELRERHLYSLRAQRVF